MNMQIGAKVMFLHYGEWRTGVVDRISSDGKIVFLTNNRWLHVSSIMLITPDEEVPNNIGE